MFLRLLLFVLIIGALLVVLTVRKASHQYHRGVRESLWDGQRPDLGPEEARRFIAGIPDQAEHHRDLVERNFGRTLSFRKSDFAVLDEIIDKGWRTSTPKNIDPVVVAFGCFFGETIRRLRGGEWVHEPGRGVALCNVGGKATIYPFEKVRKRFRNGESDSLSMFYLALSRKLDARDA